MEKGMDNLYKAIIDTVAGIDSEKIIEKITPKLDTYIKEKYGKLPELHEIKTEKETKIIKAVTHEKFDEVLKIVAAGIPVYLEGPAGTGKNVICKQVAEALGIDFYFSNAVTQEYKITGFIDANGKFHETQFFKAFTEGGLFFLDEIDASIPEVLILLNAAIANGYFDFPIGKFEAHPDFHVVAAGNTAGSGADVQYSGRYKLDAASLDRFIIVHIDYSPKIELYLADEDADLVEFCHLYRQVAKQAHIDTLFTYRAITYITKLKNVLPKHKLYEAALLKGMNEDSVQLMSSGLAAKSPKNSYIISFTSIYGEGPKEKSDGKDFSYDF